ncbi:hypothetical protein AQUCO_00600142v1 [Aquilegia coerulea]|uniref:Uncharacterized protein n=1 Tax=Aquilegia coerulea TaxID=218851 RepID=A0A2G5EN79_AQUCA|nr:hypothetical protein AQUCO_00600142v1 [Aquilegia coerulea]
METDCISTVTLCCILISTLCRKTSCSLIESRGFFHLLQNWSNKGLPDVCISYLQQRILCNVTRNLCELIMSSSYLSLNFGSQES